ncbi:MAG: phage antirepressor KilAC domain-containing protein [Ruminococcus sp.]|jgi:phage antirepressor YoqD-like protein|uniref:phage antirepressor KilAC domain-containing protein n=1 Tax=Ruminococcus sp. TaxID=41978 RepID=UPI00300F505D
MNDNLQVIETNNQRVLTTAQIAERYETTERRISENFNRNKERYTEGKHYYCLTGDVLREFKNDYANCGFVPGAKVNAFYLWTEKGALMLAKSLNTDKAWEAYEVLVDTYFSVHGLPQRDSYMIEDPVLRAQRWIEEQKEKQQLLTTVAVQNQQIAELQPKASYYDVVLNCKDLISIGKIAKDYGWSAQKLNEYLHQHGVQYKQGKTWLLYQKYAGMGYTSTKTHTYHGDDGTEHAADPHTYWTQKGRLFIYDLLKSDDIYPLIERDAA